MNYSELLHDWLDGSLQSGQEETMFLALKQEPELRAELHDLIRIRAAVQNDTAAFTPSPEDTGAIFAKLGFAVPAGIPSVAPAGFAVTNAAAGNIATGNIATSTIAAATTSAGGASAIIGASAFWAALKGFATNIAPIAASACVASLCTVLLLRWWGDGTSNSSTSINGTRNNGLGSNANFSSAQQNNSDAPTNPNNPSNLTNLNNPSLEGVYSDTIRQRVVVREIVREVVRYVARNEPPPTTTNADKSNGNTMSVETLATAETSAAPVITLASAAPADAFANGRTTKHAPMRSLALAPSLNNTFANALPTSEEESLAAILHRFRLGCRGFTTLYLPTPSMEPSATPFFNNAALSLHYALSPNRSIGLEVGQEAFFQRYQSSENQDTYTVTQYPTQWWAGVTYRYNFTPEELFSPYASATVGVATYGFLGRTQFGCTYSSDGVTQFLLGVEASALLYGHQGMNYWSPKVGVTYGVSLRL